MLAGLFTFDKFLAPTLIRIVYILGVIGIAFWTLMGVLGAARLGGMMGSYGQSFGGSLGGALIALILGAVAFLAWRVVCEVWLVIFSINDRLGVLVDRSTTERGAAGV